MEKAKINGKLGLLCQRVGQVVNTKEKFWKAIKSAIAVKRRMIESKKADMEKVLMVWLEDQSVIKFLKPKPNLEQGTSFLNFRILCTIPCHIQSLS